MEETIMAVSDGWGKRTADLGHLNMDGVNSYVCGVRTHMLNKGERVLRPQGCYNIILGSL
jgi:hypothetical protein